MDYLEPSFHHFHQHQHHHDQYAGGMVQYTDNMHDYANAMALQSNAMMAMNQKPNETKPRLGKDEVDILEKEFQKNPKPTTQTKRQFADDMGVDLSRINNWFQNRRAKRKQEKKQEAYELSQQGQDGSGYRSEPSSPDWEYKNNFGEPQPMTLQHANTFPAMTGPPQPAAPYNPKYEDPSMASQESLQRTLAAAAAAAQTSFIPQHQEFHHGYQAQHDSFGQFQGFDNHSDSAQFPSVESSVSHFDNHRSYSYSSDLVPSIADLHTSPAPHTPASFQTFASSNDAQAMNTFPSQLLPSHLPEHFQSNQHDGCESESPESSNAAMQAIGFKFENMDESDKSSPPAPTIPFKSPPPMDIASRRKKVAVKPAALTSETMKSRPPVGPRTVSHAEGFRRPSDSPMASPMRRVMSAGGSRIIMPGRSGRVSKSGYGENSPINLNGFSDAGAFLQHNYHTTRQPPSLTAGSSLNSSLAPPTPMSPRGGEMTLAKRDGAKFTESPAQGELNYIFNVRDPALFTSVERDQNLESPPETPQATFNLQPLGNEWSNNSHDFQEWSYEASERPLYTPGQDSFSVESLQMPHPSYLNSASQPVTPAFGQHFNPNFMFGAHDPSQYKQESPQYNMPNHSEYNFSEHAQYAPSLSTSPMTKQKTFQFSNQTPADFSERK